MNEYVIVATDLFNLRIEMIEKGSPRLTSLWLREKSHIHIPVRIYDIIEVIEILRGFVNNRLQTDKEYTAIVSDLRFRMVKADNVWKLRVEYEDEVIGEMDKVECSIEASKLQKAIGPCDPYAL